LVAVATHIRFREHSMRRLLAGIWYFAMMIAGIIGAVVNPPTLPGKDTALWYVGSAVCIILGIAGAIATFVGAAQGGFGVPERPDSGGRYLPTSGFQGATSLGYPRTVKWRGPGFVVYE